MNIPRGISDQIRDMPADFAPTFVDHGRYVRWSTTLRPDGSPPVPVELGFSKASGKADMAAETENLRAGAWQATELARLGRADLLAIAHPDRHKAPRPVSTLPPKPAG